MMLIVCDSLVVEIWITESLSLFLVHKHAITFKLIRRFIKTFF